MLSLSRAALFLSLASLAVASAPSPSVDDAAPILDDYQANLANLLTNAAVELTPDSNLDDKDDGADLYIMLKRESERCQREEVADTMDMNRSTSRCGCRRPFICLTFGSLGARGDSDGSLADLARWTFSISLARPERTSAPPRGEAQPRKGRAHDPRGTMARSRLEAPVPDWHVGMPHLSANGLVGVR